MDDVEQKGAMSKGVMYFPVYRVQRERINEMADALVVEEPLEIRLNNFPLAVVMRTPGDDLDLARGFILTEGIIRTQGSSEMQDGARHNLPVASCNLLEVDWARDELGLEIPNVVNCRVAAISTAEISGWQRHLYASSSCGLCGRASIDRVRLQASVLNGHWQISFSQLNSLPEKLRARQIAFDSTGGLHAAALFSQAGEIVVMREDVGRHNAVDKVLGWAMQRAMVPLNDFGLLVSGRLSFEIVQKVLLAGIPLLAGISAASSLAVELANETNMTLVGFLRGENAVVYSASHRIQLRT
jgi:FdhD protein